MQSSLRQTDPLFIICFIGISPMNSTSVADNDPPPVWPDLEGEVWGMSFSPLYKSALSVANKDSKIYKLLVLVDDIHARERNFARKALITL